MTIEYDNPETKTLYKNRPVDYDSNGNILLSGLLKGIEDVTAI
jgi:hypothetical protein